MIFCYCVANELNTILSVFIQRVGVTFKVQCVEFNGI